MGITDEFLLSANRCSGAFDAGPSRAPWMPAQGVRVPGDSRRSCTGDRYPWTRPACLPLCLLPVLVVTLY